jgi:hypothetical protein
MMHLLHEPTFSVSTAGPMYNEESEAEVRRRKRRATTSSVTEQQLQCLPPLPLVVSMCRGGARRSAFLTARKPHNLKTAGLAELTGFWLTTIPQVRVLQEVGSQVTEFAVITWTVFLIGTPAVWIWPTWDATKLIGGHGR